MKLLHITVHMGGGVGRAISEIVTNKKDGYQHEIICLEEPKNEQFIFKCIQSGVLIVWELTLDKIISKIKNSDIIILHWWHHPVMIHIIIKLSMVKSRVVIWSHINGCFYPWISYEFLRMHDTIFVTSKFTLENKEWESWQRNELRQKAYLVYGMGSLDQITRKKSYKEEEKIRIGFTGTFSQSKVNSSYVAACEQIISEVPNVEFQIFGSVDPKDNLYCEIEKKKLMLYFNFRGYLTEVTSELHNLDIFGYPLNPEHFGTTENAIIEAMAAGLPVVLLDQNTEKYIVKNGYNGLLVKNMNTYVQSVVFLTKHYRFREYLGKNARNDAIRYYNSKNNLKQFYYGIESAKVCIPKIINYSGYFGINPHEWFLKGMNKSWREIFLIALDTAEKGDLVLLKKFLIQHPILKEKTKSSVTHFADYFTDSSVLQKWKKYIELVNEEENKWD